MTLGAYVALFLLGMLFPRIGLESTGLGPFTFGYPVFLALPLTMLVLAAVAIGLDVGVYRRLRRRGGQQCSAGHDIPWCGHRFEGPGPGHLGWRYVAVSPAIRALLSASHGRPHSTR